MSDEQWVTRDQGVGGNGSGGDLMGVAIRAATEGDAATIRAIVREAQINPLNLDWPRFLVAEEGGVIVAVGQVKPHGDGSRELASIAVIPSHRRQGLGGQIIRALLARESGPIYLTCGEGLEPYYARFGFRLVAPADLPTVIRRIIRIGRFLTSIAARLNRDQGQLIAMRREAMPPSSVSGSAGV